MPHHKVRLKTQSYCQANFIFCASQHSRQPPAFSRVGKQENDIMFFDQLFQSFHILQHLLDRFFVLANRMSWHWYFQSFTSGFHHRKHLSKSFSGYWGFEIIRFDRVFVGEQALSYWVGVRHFSCINKSNFPISPRHKISCYLAPKTSRSKQQTARLLEYIKLQTRRHPPLHQFKVQISSILNQLLRIQLILEIDNPSLHFNKLMILFNRLSSWQYHFTIKTVIQIDIFTHFG